MTGLNYIRTIALFLLIFSASASAETSTVTIYTENLPPYNYLTKDGELKGVSTDVVSKVMDATGLAYTIKVEPWVRAKRNAATDKNSLIYSMVRTPEREKLFHWLIMLRSEPFYLFGRWETKARVSKETIKNGQFTALCMGEDVTCGVLKRAGFPESNLLNLTSTGAPLITFKLMASGRADFSVDTPISIAERGIDTTTFGPIYRLDETADFYLAAGQNTSQKVQQLIRQTYEKLIREGQVPPVQLNLDPIISPSSASANK